MKNITIFASGAGSNAQKIIEHFNHSENRVCRVALIGCNNEKAGVLTIAQKENIPVLHINKQTLYQTSGCIQTLQEYHTDLIVLAGFLWKIPNSLIDAFPGRIINIHPALLPAYGGKGMYGSKVHQAVISAGEKESGITIHFVDGHYDNGDIIFQEKCKVLPTDNADTLAARVHSLEHKHYAPVIEKIIRQLS